LLQAAMVRANVAPDQSKKARFVEECMITDSCCF
jgi:hypothetical protein